MAKSDELVKYITQQVVTYIDTPKAVRQHAKALSKEQRESWQTRWFGMLPLAARMLMDQFKPKK
ncbi:MULTISPECIES: YqzE family protein [Paenibacillus]|uniref:YqzE family protein n=2 Tax=Paenibacillus TaxID=44249 RepID=A0A1V4HK08_9BACL|nr:MULTISPECIES: YqzE family protein [Paenibacillus]MEC0229204.1 YqzE family protein [Paenibacillus alba]OPH57147.1 YqzE family protein [Paenibacillus ferrarius]